MPSFTTLYQKFAETKVFWCALKYGNISLNSYINYCFRTYCPVVSINTLSNTRNFVKFCVPSLLINIWWMYQQFGFYSEPRLLKSQNHKIYFQSFTHNTKKKYFISFQLQKSFKHSSLYLLVVKQAESSLKLV